MAKRSSLIRSVALVTLASGVANLYFAIHPQYDAHGPLLHDLAPLEFFHFPRSFTLLIGLALVISAINIYKGKRRAFHHALALSSLSVVAHLLNGRDYEQAALSLVLIGMLWWARRDFTVGSSPPDWRWAVIHLTVAALVALGCGVAGFWLIDEREFGINFTLSDSIFFSPSRRCFIAYGVGANFAIALADPVSPPEEIAETIDRFRRFCEDNIIPSYHPGEATIDLMRHRTDAPNGVMDYLFVKLMLRDRAEGYTRFNFGLALMSGFQEREEASATERAVYQFFQLLTFLCSFGGLKAYKAKFASHWEPRYIIYRHALDMSKVGGALGKVSKLK